MVWVGLLFDALTAPSAPLVFAGAWPMLGGGIGAVAVLFGTFACWAGLGMMMVLVVAMPCWFRGSVRNALMAFGSGFWFVMVMRVLLFFRFCFF